MRIFYYISEIGFNYSESHNFTANYTAVNKHLKQSTYCDVDLALRISKNFSL